MTCVFYKSEGCQTLDLSDIPDEDIGSGLLGEGYAILPEDGFIRSPINGNIVLVADSKHAIGIRNEDGVEVLIHMGVDGVSFMGRGLEVLVSVGDRVQPGDVLIRYDQEIYADEKDRITAIVVTNHWDYKIKRPGTEHVMEVE